MDIRQRIEELLRKKPVHIDSETIKRGFRNATPATRREFLYFFGGALCGSALGISGLLYLAKNYDPHAPKNNGVHPIPIENRTITNLSDIQGILGLQRDNLLGPQTKYGLETLLLDIEAEHNIPFQKVPYPQIDRRTFQILNAVHNDTLPTTVRNIEALAFQHYGAYIMSPDYRSSHTIIQTKEQAAAFLGLQKFSDQKLRENVLAFKAILNYLEGISLPINTKLDHTAYIALTYARDKHIPFIMKGFSHSEVEIQANRRGYSFLIPNVALFQRPTKYESVENIVNAVDPRDPVIRRIALNVADSGHTPKQEAQRLLNFVQGPNYSFDVVGGNTVKHPVQTLDDRTGDCEDSTVLYLSLLRARGIECAYIHIDDRRPREPGHAIAGVVGDFGYRHGLTRKGKNFYFAETTGKGHAIGDPVLPSVDSRHLGFQLVPI